MKMTMDLQRRRLAMVAAPAAFALAASLSASNIYPAIASDPNTTIKIEINGKMLYFPIGWADWIALGDGQPEYDNHNPNINVTYRTSFVVQRNRATRAWNERRIFWNTDLWPDFRITQLQIRVNHAEPLNRPLSQAFPDGWWPLPTQVDPTREGIGLVSCQREHSQLRAEFGIYDYLGCTVMRRVADGLSIRYQWNRLEVGEQNEREQDRRVQHLVEWLLTPPDRRTARPID